MNTTMIANDPTLYESKEYVGALGAKGGVTIPAEVRRFLKVTPHDKLVFRIRDNKVELDTAEVMTLEEAYGSVAPLPDGKTVEDALRAAKEERAKRLMAHMRP